VQDKNSKIDTKTKESSSKYALTKIDTQKEFNHQLQSHRKIKPRDLQLATI
jgi:hypothetical protein